MFPTIQISRSSGRAALHNEVHARPPEAMEASLAISQVVMLCDAGQREASRQHVAALLRERHLSPPDADSTPIRMDVGLFRIRWELHTEFVSYTFSRPLEAQSLVRLATDREPLTAADGVPQGWLAQLPGQCLGSITCGCCPSLRWTTLSWSSICCMRTRW